MCEFINFKQCKPKVLIDLFFHQQPPLRAHTSVFNDYALLAIRVFSFLYLTGVFIYDFIIMKSMLQKFLYITNVSYFFSWLYFAVIVQHKLLSHRAKGLDQWAQLIFQAAFCLQWLITSCYWLVLRQDKYTSIDFYTSFNAHGITLILLILDCIFNSYRFIPTQYTTFIIICTVYLMVINMPFALGVKAVYGRAMDWVSWQTYLMIIAAFLISVAVFMISRVLYVKFKYPRLQGKQYEGSLNPFVQFCGKKKQKQTQAQISVQIPSNIISSQQQQNSIIHIKKKQTSQTLYSQSYNIVNKVEQNKQ